MFSASAVRALDLRATRVYERERRRILDKVDTRRAEPLFGLKYDVIFLIPYPNALAAAVRPKPLRTTELRERLYAINLLCTKRNKEIRFVYISSCKRRGRYASTASFGFPAKVTTTTTQR